MRRSDKILKELAVSCRILKECGANLGGVHFELTGDNVTECIGGASGVTEADLPRDYRTQMDPRLNYEQAMELALLLARLMAGEPGKIQPKRRPAPSIWTYPSPFVILSFSVLLSLFSFRAQTSR